MRHVSEFFRKKLWLTSAVIASVSATAAEPLKNNPSFSQHIYVWQRSWTPAVRQSVQANGPVFAGLDVLVAELSWRETPGRIDPFQPDWPSLLATGRPIGLVVRAGAYTGSFAEDAAGAHTLIDACVQALARARAAGIEPAELQIDFDAATSRLADYHTWLLALRRHVHPPRLVITALPDWLRSPDFAALAHEVDAYVLQVHSLEKPVSADQSFSLCDPGRARVWVREASALGVPFRVALPAYGYRVAFGADGKFIGLQAEGPARAWPAGTSVRTVLADPASLAELIRELRTAPPPACEGVVWFRLPNPNDELAWRWATLVAVVSGEIPHSRPALLLRETAEGTLDLTVAVQGNTHVAPAGFRLRWRGAELVAADTIGGWKLEHRGAGELVLSPPVEAHNDLLFPGDRREIGWIRLSARTAVDVTSLD